MNLNINGIHYSIDYQSKTDFPIFYAPELSLYNVDRENNVSDTNLSVQLHAGIDFKVSDKNTIGVRFTFTDMGSIDYKGHYSIHPMHTVDPNFSFNETFHGIKNYKVVFLFKKN